MKNSNDSADILDEGTANRSKVRLVCSRSCLRNELLLTSRYSKDNVRRAAYLPCTFDVHCTDEVKYDNKRCSGEIVCTDRKQQRENCNTIDT